MIIISNPIQSPSANQPRFLRGSEAPISDDRCKVVSSRCQQVRTADLKVNDDTPSDWVRTYPWLNSALFPVASQSLLYCAVPKVASKNLISLIIYVYVRDILQHLKGNQTGIEVGVERLINLPKLIDQLHKGGIRISENSRTMSVSSLLESYLHLLRFESVNNASSSLFFNPWRLDLKEIFPAIHFTSIASVSQLFAPSFTRILFVRHPFERLASAYKERIATLTKDRVQPEPHYDHVRKLICLRYGRLSTVVSRPWPRHQACEETIPSFENFVQFILEGTNTSVGIARMDGHWKPFTAVCQTCRLQYNFIGTYETFEQDFSTLLQRLNVSDWSIQKRRGASGYNRQNYQQLFSSMPDELICRLKNLYSEDLHLFNYRIEDYVNRTTLICPS